MKVIKDLLIIIRPIHFTRFVYFSQFRAVYKIFFGNIWNTSWMLKCWGIFYFWSYLGNLLNFVLFIYLCCIRIMCYFLLYEEIKSCFIVQYSCNCRNNDKTRILAMGIWGSFRQVKKKKKWPRHINLNKYWVIGFRLKLKLFLRKICMRSYKQCTHSFPDKWLFHLHVLFISLTLGGKCGRYFFLLSISITTHRNNFDKLVCRR